LYKFNTNKNDYYIQDIGTSYTVAYISTYTPSLSLQPLTRFLSDVADISKIYLRTTLLFACYHV